MNNWYVITGGPSAGKTTLIEYLEEKGLHVEHETARIYLDQEIAKGRTVEEIRQNEEEFQRVVYQLKLDRERETPGDKLVFFDRGMPDTYAYNKLHNFPISEDMEKEVFGTKYKKVFILEPLKFEQDYARTESDEEAKKLFILLKEAYERNGDDVEVVPVLPKAERAEYVLEILCNDGIDKACS